MNAFKIQSLMLTVSWINVSDVEVLIYLRCLGLDCPVGGSIEDTCCLDECLALPYPRINSFKGGHTATLGQAVKWKSSEPTQASFKSLAVPPDLAQNELFSDLFCTGPVARNLWGDLSGR